MATSVFSALVLMIRVQPRASHESPKRKLASPPVDLDRKAQGIHAAPVANRSTGHPLRRTDVNPDREKP